MIKDIIINADDFGMKDSINNEIESMIKQKLISSATIMANGLAFYGVKKIVNENPHISFGIHLNIVEFECLSKDDTFRKFNLVNNNFEFRYQEIFRIKEFTKELKDAIKNEFRIQIEKLKENDIPISHIDGHQHCHGIIELQNIIIELANEFGIRKIRRKFPPKSPLTHLKNKLKISGSTTNKIPKNTTERINKQANIILRAINYFKKHIHYIYWTKVAKKYFIMTDSFCSYSDYIARIEYKNDNSKLVELMCHPGHEEFVLENSLLTKNKLQKLTVFRLVTYNNL